jgi:hypothetical protein
MNKRKILEISLAWLAAIGWDFLLHGGLLAWIYAEKTPFLLGPLEAFARIPIGYASFLLLVLLIEWLMPKFEIEDSKRAWIFGLKLGAFVWAALVIGLYSIATIRLSTAIAWWVGQTLSMGVMAFVLFKAQQSTELRKIGIRVLIFVVIAIVLTIILQNMGLAPQIVI